MSTKFKGAEGFSLGIGAHLEPVINQAQGLGIGAVAFETKAEAKVRAEQELRDKYAASLKEQAERLGTEDKPDPLNDELAAMRSVARTLEKLPRDVQDRVVTWLCNRLPPRYQGLGDPVGR